MDVVSVTCFVVALVLRTAWMLRMAMAQVSRYEEDIDAREWDDDTSLSFDTYVRMRLTFQYYRYCRNFLAAGVLVNFVKAFKFLSVSKQLSQFTETIYVVSVQVGVEARPFSCSYQSGGGSLFVLRFYLLSNIAKKQPTGFCYSTERANLLNKPTDSVAIFHTG